MFLYDSELSTILLAGAAWNIGVTSPENSCVMLKPVFISRLNPLLSYERELVGSQFSV